MEENSGKKIRHSVELGIVLQIGHNFTPGCSGFASVETAAYGGWKSGFGFVADLREENDAGIAEKICVGYKGIFANSGLIS